MGGHGEIAYGNAIGSIICNTSLIAALTIAIRPSGVDKKALRMPLAFFFIAAVFYAFTAYLSGYFSRVIGLVLLAMFAVYLYLTISQARKEAAAPVQAAPEAAQEPLWREVLLLVTGAALIAAGARLLVDNGTLIAQALGVPESVIALTFVALGTSLPELVTAVTSLIKGHSALSLGNIIGANLFNLVLVSGVATTLAPFALPQGKTIGGMNASLVVDMPLMFVGMLLITVPALRKGRLSRWQGVTLLCLYAAFCMFQFFL